MAKFGGGPKASRGRSDPKFGRLKGGTKRVPGGKTPARPTSRAGRARASRFSGFATPLRNRSGQFVSGGRGFAWQGLDAVIKNMDDVSRTFYQRTRREADRLADRMETYARGNARWQDHTGDARAGLKAVVIDASNGEGFTIAFGHSVYYGFFLEYHHGGQYAIVYETLQWATQQLEGKMETELWS